MSPHHKELNTSSLMGAGLKVTAPRVKILELFQKQAEREQAKSGPSRGGHHLSAEDVYRTLVQERLDIGLATVYRVLAQFEQAGILIRHHFGANDKAVYELADSQHHDHLVCLDCGHVEEFFDPEIEKRQSAVAASMGFSLADHALSLYGHCIKPSCPKRPDSSKPLVA